jgi:DNA-binding Lrp family transcriptional regulator
MVLGYVLIGTVPAKEREAYEFIKDNFMQKARKDAKVTELHPIFGEYDMIAKIEAENSKIMGEFICNHVRTSPGVMDTITLTCIDNKF